MGSFNKTDLNTGVFIKMFWNFFKKKSKPPSTDNASSFTPVQDKKTSITKKHDIPFSFLKRLSPLDQLLSEKDLQKLPVDVALFAPETIIFTAGSLVTTLMYIVKGNLYLEANNGFGYELTADSFMALYPLSSGQQHYFTATSKSDVSLVYVSKDVFQKEPCVPESDKNELKTSEALQDNLFFTRFYKNFSHGVQAFPSFPEVALKLRAAIENDCGIDEIVKIVRLDPVITAKLINAANSVMYRAVCPIGNCSDAITRIGLRSTCYMVTAFSMNKLFSSNNPAIQLLIQNCWMQSIKVSSICHALAQTTEHIDPEEALIAGLLHNIGTLPILTFADRLEGYSYDADDLDLCINEIQGQIGSIVLENWGFPRHLSQIPLQSTNWYTSITEKLNLNDIVLLAKYHALLESPGNSGLPLFISLPAFQKLNNRSLTPEMSLQILDDAKEQVAETVRFFLS